MGNKRAKAKEAARRKRDEKRRVRSAIPPPTPNKARTTPGSRPKEKFRIPKRIWQGVVAVAVLAGLFGAAYQFKPDLVIESDISLNPREPFSTEFRVTNVGAFTLRTIRFSCVVENPNMHNVELKNMVGQFPVSELPPKDSATITCPAIGGSYPFESELTITVSARPSWYWGRLEWHARFVNIRDSTGILRWIRQPSKP